MGSPTTFKLGIFASPLAHGTMFLSLRLPSGSTRNSKVRSRCCITLVTPMVQSPLLVLKTGSIHSDGLSIANGLPTTSKVKLLATGSLTRADSLSVLSTAPVIWLHNSNLPRLITWSSTGSSTERFEICCHPILIDYEFDRKLLYFITHPTKYSSVS